MLIGRRLLSHPQRPKLHPWQVIDKVDLQLISLRLAKQTTIVVSLELMSITFRTFSTRTASCACYLKSVVESSLEDFMIDIRSRLRTLLQIVGSLARSNSIKSQIHESSSNKEKKRKKKNKQL